LLDTYGKASRSWASWAAALWGVAEGPAVDAPGFAVDFVVELLPDPQPAMISARPSTGTTRDITELVPLK
jgi:hypothetical protein